MSSSRPRPPLGLIGAGAFGQFVVPHLASHFDIVVADPRPDLPQLAQRLGIRAGTLEEAAAAPVVILAVPVQAMAAAAEAIAPHVRAGAMVLDVGSVKVKPAAILSAALPEHVDVVCTHPLFGPQSARGGIEGLKIAVCHVRGARTRRRVAAFCRRVLRLTVIDTTPERHDREVAYVQGITHLIGKTLITMDLEDFRQTTVSYDLLRQAVGFIADDSAELFRAIELENPFAAEARQAFFDAVRRVETVLAHHAGEDQSKDAAPARKASPAA